MKNYEQIRAKNALAAADKYGFKGKNDGEVVKKIPNLIIDNGILATCAFAKERGKGYDDVFNAVIEHLSDPEISLVRKGMSVDDFIKHLSEISSADLRHITAETMAYLNYLRRFV